MYTKVLAHNLNDIRNWASLIGLLLRICWCLLSVFLIYCSDEWKKLVNLIYCFQVLFRMNFKIMYFLMKILGNSPSTDSAASRDSLSSQNATWGIVFFSSFYWWHIEYKGWMCERLLNLQEIYVSGQNICIEVYGNSVGTITPIVDCSRPSRLIIESCKFMLIYWFRPNPNIGQLNQMVGSRYLAGLRLTCLQMFFHWHVGAPLYNIWVRVSPIAIHDC